MLEKNLLLAAVTKSKFAEVRLISDASELQTRDAALFITKGVALLRDHSVFDTTLPESTPPNREPIQYSKTDFCFTTKTHLKSHRFAKISLYFW